MDNVKKQIGANIKNYMDIFKINQHELAKKLGVANTTVSMWVTGGNIPRMDKIDKMCEIFGCRRDDFLGDPKDPSYVISSKQSIDLLLQIEGLSPENKRKVNEYIKMLTAYDRLEKEEQEV